MINVENDFEPITYEKPIYSHIYQNHDQFQQRKYNVFFQQRENNANKNHAKNQLHQYAQNYFPSDDDEYYNQNHQQFSSNPRPRSYSIDQP